MSRTAIDPLFSPSQPGSDNSLPTPPAPPPPFEKVLWRKQPPYPDNHVGSFFLSSLGKGAHRPILDHAKDDGGVSIPSPTRPTLPSLLLSSTPMTQQLLTILLFTSLYSHLLLRQISPITLLLLITLTSSLASLFLLLGAFTRSSTLNLSSSKPQQALLHPNSSTTSTRSNHVDSASKFNGVSPSTSPRVPIVSLQPSSSSTPILSLALLITVLLALSPVLRTLTSATTSDSIWALATALFGLHFALADHALPTVEGVGEEVKGGVGEVEKESIQAIPFKGHDDAEDLMTLQAATTTSSSVVQETLGTSPTSALGSSEDEDKEASHSFINSDSKSTTSISCPHARSSPPSSPIVPPSSASAPPSSSTTTTTTTTLLPTLSLNAAICASVVLASRLPDDLSVFSLLYTSIHLFAFFPLVRKRLATLLLVRPPRSRIMEHGQSNDSRRQQSTSSSSLSSTLRTLPHHFLTLLLLLLVLSLLHPLSSPALFATLLATGFLNLACPLWLWWAFRNAEEKGWKVMRSGDWDVAEPRLGRGREGREERRGRAKDERQV